MKVIALGLVAAGFAAVMSDSWYDKVGGVSTVLLGVAVFCYPDPRDHLRLYRRTRNGLE